MLHNDLHCNCNASSLCTKVGVQQLSICLFHWMAFFSTLIIHATTTLQHLTVLNHFDTKHWYEGKLWTSKPLQKKCAFCFLLLFVTFSADCPRVSSLGLASTKGTTTERLSYSKKKRTTLATTKALIEQLSFSIELSIAFNYKSSCFCRTVASDSTDGLL